jgi:hypothetical protein
VFTWFTGRSRCFGGKHERSEKHIERTGADEGYVSKCRFCGTPMRRLGKRNWIVISRSEYRDARKGVLAS